MKPTPVLLLLAACLLSPFAVANDQPADSSAHPPKGSFNEAGLKELSARAEKELRDNILPFWLKHTRNIARGGFHGQIDGDMTVHVDAPRGALMTSRILWTFSTAYRTYHDPEYLAMAQWAYRDLTDNFTDKESGGLYWTITADGQPLDTRKQIYGQVFGLYALAEYYRATGEKPALDQSIAIYRLVEKNAHDPKYGGYFDSFDRKWQRADAINFLGKAPKTQNSHIHILEAYTNLLRAWPDAGLRANHRDLIEVMMKHIIDPRHHLVLFMKEDWTPTGEEISYGHDIELSWLLYEAAEVQGDHALVARARPESLAIAQATLIEGTDTDGAILNEGNPHGVISSRKDWWPQAEAVVGYLNAYQLSGDPRYFVATRKSWDFIEAKLVDRKHGEWYRSLNRDGTPLPGPKVGVWYCPYHNGRSCFEVMERVKKLTSAGRKS